MSKIEESVVVTMNDDNNLSVSSKFIKLKLLSLLFVSYNSFSGVWVGAM